MIHVTFTTAIFGFIDDMYLETSYDFTYKKSVVNIMSELRIGQNDFGENTNHVLKMLNCLDDNLKVSEYDACSAWNL